MHLFRRDANHKHLYLLANGHAKKPELPTEGEKERERERERERGRKRRRKREKKLKRKERRSERSKINLYSLASPSVWVVEKVCFLFESNGRFD